MCTVRHVLFALVVYPSVNGFNNVLAQNQSNYFGYLNDIQEKVVGEATFLNSLINAIIFRARNITSPIETTVSLAQAAGYGAEEYQVKTFDNYILTLHRIYKGNEENKSNIRDNVLDKNGNEGMNYKHNKKGVIFLQHGLMGSSDNWVTTVKHECLAYKLADLGYDVWLGNFRGNIYSRGHTNLTHLDPSYWKFSYDEMAEYDLPAMINYVLSATNSSSIHYIGHSMGSTAFFASASSSRFLETRIKSMIALAPATVMSSRNVLTPIKYLAPLAKQLQIFLQLFGNGDELLTNRLLISLWDPYRACKFRYLCDNLQFMITGFDPFRAHKEMLPLILSHNPAGSSTQTLIHFAQVITSEKFRKYDWGIMENLRRYGQTTPPKYDISKINIPVTLFWASNDWFIGEEDVDYLEQNLPKLKASHRVKNSEFSHLDFLWATDAYDLVYDKILRYYESNEMDEIQEKNEVTYKPSAREPRQFSFFQNIIKILLS